ncbi:hypothetical protein IWQ62_002645 [Dispira parvispora]|uniref:Nucleoside diphosphate kinase n=1 Tax=Dispira parvispora TaxID=1520584 RepID=A0A9W8AVA2_9FUNG|nr:hypothetical protein IWQ62_002645 [Dispira parvispora]
MNATTNDSRTLALIKPDGLVSDKYVNIKSLITLAELQIVRQKKLWLTREHVITLLAIDDDHVSDYQEVLDYLTSMPCLALELHKPNAVKSWLELVGPDNLEDARNHHPDSIRSMFAVDTIRNTAHAPKDIAESERQLEFLFSPEIAELDFTLSETPSQKGMKRTFACIKPDAMSENRKDDIVKQILARGYRILASQERQLSHDEAAEFYSYHAGQIYYDQYVGFMSSGPVYMMLLEGEDVVDGWREMMGPTNPIKARRHVPMSIRAKFGNITTRNAVHGSSSDTAAQRAIDIFFSNAQSSTKATHDTPSDRVPPAEEPMTKSISESTVEKSADEVVNLEELSPEVPSSSEEAVEPTPPSPEHVADQAVSASEPVPECVTLEEEVVPPTKLESPDQPVATVVEEALPVDSGVETGDETQENMLPVVNSPNETDKDQVMSQNSDGTHSSSTTEGGEQFNQSAANPADIPEADEISHESSKIQEDEEPGKLAQFDTSSPSMPNGEVTDEALSVTVTGVTPEDILPQESEGEPTVQEESPSSPKLKPEPEQEVGAASHDSSTVETIVNDPTPEPVESPVDMVNTEKVDVTECCKEVQQKVDPATDLSTSTLENEVNATPTAVKAEPFKDEVEPVPLETKEETKPITKGEQQTDSDPTTSTPASALKSPVGKSNSRITLETKSKPLSASTTDKSRPLVRRGISNATTKTVKSPSSVSRRAPSTTTSTVRSSTAAASSTRARTSTPSTTTTSSRTSRVSATATSRSSGTSARQTSAVAASTSRVVKKPAPTTSTRPARPTTTTTSTTRPTTTATSRRSTLDPPAAKPSSSTTVAATRAARRVTSSSVRSPGTRTTTSSTVKPSTTSSRTTATSSPARSGTSSVASRKPALPGAARSGTMARSTSTVSATSTTAKPSTATTRTASTNSTTRTSAIRTRPTMTSTTSPSKANPAVARRSVPNTTSVTGVRTKTTGTSVKAATVSGRKPVVRPSVATKTGSTVTGTVRARPGATTKVSATKAVDPSKSKPAAASLPTNGIKTTESPSQTPLSDGVTPAAESEKENVADDNAHPVKVKVAQDNEEPPRPTEELTEVKEAESRLTGEHTTAPEVGPEV